MTPVLSICIPTYNRFSLLNQCLESIVSQELFLRSEKVEIVISDNCSTDETAEVAKRFVSKYPFKIKYFKTSENIGFDNFEYVLKKGSGLFLKLHNDYLLLKENSLTRLVEIIEENQTEKPILFFRNKTKDNCLCQNLDSFIHEVSFFNTWIGSFGMWRSDFARKNDWFKYNSSLLPQTDILCRIISEGQPVVVINEQLFDGLSVSKKGGYNIAEVFGHNYLGILKNYVTQGYLSAKIYKKEKKRLLLRHINPFYFDLKKQWAFSKTGYFKWLMPDYKYCLYFYLAYIKIMFSCFIRRIRNFFV